MHLRNVVTNIPFFKVLIVSLISFLTTTGPTHAQHAQCYTHASLSQYHPRWHDEDYPLKKRSIGKGKKSNSFITMRLNKIWERPEKQIGFGTELCNDSLTVTLSFRAFNAEDKDLHIDYDKHTVNGDTLPVFSDGICCWDQTYMMTTIFYTLESILIRMDQDTVQLIRFEKPLFPMTTFEYFECYTTLDKKLLMIRFASEQIKGLHGYFMIKPGETMATYMWHAYRDVYVPLQDDIFSRASKRKKFKYSIQFHGCYE